MEIQFSGGTGGGVTDHGSLQGLGDDDHRQYVLRYGDPTGQEVYGGTEPNQMLLLGGTYREEATEKGIVALDDNTPLRLSRIDEMHVPPAHSGPGSLNDIEGGIIYVPYADPDPTAVQGALYYSDGLRWILLEGQVMDTTPPSEPTGIDLDTGTLPDGRSWIDIEWLPNEEDDLVGYIVFRKDEAIDGWTSVSYVYADPSAVEIPHYIDYAVITNEDYWYGVAAYDKWGNVSDVGIPDQVFINAGDKTRPPDVTGEDGVALGNTAVITWIDPTGVEDLWKIEIWRHDTADTAYLARWGQSTLVAEVPAGVQRYTYVRVAADASVDTDRFYISAMDTAKNKSHPKPSTVVAGYPPYVDVTFNNTVWSRGTLVLADTQPNENGWWGGNVTVTVSAILTADEIDAGITAIDYYYIDEDGAIQLMESDQFIFSSETDGTNYSFFVEMSDGTYTAPTQFSARIDSTPPPKITSSFGIKQRGTSWVTLTWDEVTDALSGTWGYNIYRSYTTTFPGVSGLLGFTSGLTFTDATVPDTVTVYYWATAVDLAGNESDETDSCITLVPRSPEFTVGIHVETPPNENGWWNSDIHIDLSVINKNEYPLPLTDFVFDCRLLSSGGFKVWNGSGYTSYSGGSELTYREAVQTNDPDEHELVLTSESLTTKGNTVAVITRVDEDVLGQAEDVFVISSKASTMRFKIDKTGPSAPNLNAATDIAGGVALTWSNGTDALSGLWKTVIYRSTDDSNYYLLDTIDALTLYYEDKSMLVGTLYYYKVANVDKAGNEGTLSSATSTTGGPEAPTAQIALTESGVPTNGWFGSRFTITMDAEVPAGETVSKYCFVMAENGVVPAEDDYYEITGNTVNTRDLRYNRGEEYGEDPNNSLDYDECTPTEGRTFWAFVKYVSGAQSAKVTKQYFIDVLVLSGGPTTNSAWTIDGTVVSWTPPTSYSVSGFDKGVLLRTVGLVSDVVASINSSAAGTFLDAGAPENTEHVVYKVEWYNKAGNSVGATAADLTTGSRNDSHIRLWLDPEPNKNGWNNSAVKVYWAMNTTGFEVAAWYYSINGAAWTNAGTATYVSVSTQGLSTVEVYASTSDGLHTPTESIQFKIDTVGPTAPAITSVDQGEGDSSTVVLLWTDGSDPLYLGNALSGLAFTEIWRSKTSTFASASRVGIVPYIDSVFWYPTWVDHSVENSTRYYYWVRHIDGAGNPGTESNRVDLKVESAQLRANKNYIDNSSFERRTGTSADKLSNWSGSYSVVSPDPNGAAPFHGQNALWLGSGQSATQLGIPIIENINDGKQPYFLFSIYGRALTSGSGVFITIVAKDVDGETLRWAGGTGELSCRLFSPLVVQGVESRVWYYGTTAIGKRWIIGPGTTSVYDYWGGAPSTNGGQLPAATATLDVTISADGQIEVDAIMMEQVDPNGNQIENELDSNPSKYYDSRVINTDRINAVVGRFLELSANRVTAGVLSSLDGKTYFDLNNSNIVLYKDDNDSTALSTSGIVRSYYGTTQNGTTKVARRFALPHWYSGTGTSYTIAQVTSGEDISIIMPYLLSCGATLIGNVVRLADNTIVSKARPVGYYYSSARIGHGIVEMDLYQMTRNLRVNATYFWTSLIGSTDTSDIYIYPGTADAVPYFGSGLYGPSNGYQCSTEIILWAEFAYNPIILIP